MNIYFIFAVMAVAAVFLYIKFLSPHVQGITSAVKTKRPDFDEEEVEVDDVLPKSYEKRINIKTQNQKLSSYIGCAIIDGKYKGLTIMDVELGKFSHDEFFRGTLLLALNPSIYQEEVTWKELEVTERKENTLLDIKVDLDFGTKRAPKQLFVD